MSSSHRAHRHAAKLLLLAEGLERFAYFSLLGNLTLFLQNERLKWSPSDANNAALFTSGVAFLIGFFAGWLSDAFGRRSYHIIGGYAVYLIGLAVMTALAYHTDVSKDAKLSSFQYVLWGLLLSAVGTGIISTNVAPFGGDQVLSELCSTFFLSYAVILLFGSYVSFDTYFNHLPYLKALRWCHIGCHYFEFRCRNYPSFGTLVPLLEVLGSSAAHSCTLF